MKEQVTWSSKNAVTKEKENTQGHECQDLKFKNVVFIISVKLESNLRFCQDLHLSQASAADWGLLL